MCMQIANRNFASLIAQFSTNKMSTNEHTKRKKKHSVKRTSYTYTFENKKKENK